MTLALRLVLAGAVALGFTSVGEAVLWRRSSSVAEANTALVLGMGVCAAALFPLTLVAPRHALDIVLLALAAAVAVAIVRRRHRRPAAFSAQPSSMRPPFIPMLLAALAAATFVVLDLRHNLFWDGFAIWTSKAQLLFVQGGLPRGWYTGEVYEARYASYPTLIPLYEAILARLLGGFEFDSFKPVFVVFHLSMAVSVYSAVRTRASSRLAAWSTAMVVFVPALSTQWAAGGYADMPQAAGVAAVVAASFRGDGAALPWLIGTLAMWKPEGLIFALLSSAAALAARWAHSPRARAGGLLRPAAIVATFVALRIMHERWAGVRDPVYVFQSVRLSLSRVPEIARLAARELLNPGAWGLLWPAFLAAAVILFRRGDWTERACAGATSAGIVVMMGPFLITTWPLRLHFEQAYFRLLAQLAPAAVVAIVLAYARARAVVDPVRGSAPAAP